MDETDIFAQLVGYGLAFCAIYGTKAVQAKLALMVKRLNRGPKGGQKAKFSMSTAQAFSGDGCNMEAGAKGRGGYWLKEQVPVAHAGATPKRSDPIIVLVFKDLSYYDKFAPRTVGTYDWARMA